MQLSATVMLQLSAPVAGNISVEDHDSHNTMKVVQRLRKPEHMVGRCATVSDLSDALRGLNGSG